MIFSFIKLAKLAIALTVNLNSLNTQDIRFAVMVCQIRDNLKTISSLITLSSDGMRRKAK
ncbi:MAG: hypothetical protein AB4080_15485 [Trichodesmium sp.]